MDENLTPEALSWQITWRTIRQMFAGLGQGTLGVLLLIFTDAFPLGWKPLAMIASVAALQIWLVVKSVKRMIENWRAHEQVWNELLPLMRLEGLTVDRRRSELKKLEDAYFSAAITPMIPAVFGLVVLYFCVPTLLLTLGMEIPEWFPLY